MLSIPMSATGSEFCQAESLAARIVTILRPEHLSTTERQCLEQYPFPPDSVREALARIPACSDIYDRILAEKTVEQVKALQRQLSDQLRSSESTHPNKVEELERLLFRAVCFEQVWAEELDDVEKLRNLRKAPGEPDAHFIGETILNRANDAKLCGLCLSGGGVRSATFNLGILQGMAKYGVLHRVDYLSTVSGGGYIGAWLAGWIKRKGFERVHKALLCEDKALLCEDPAPRFKDLEPIAFLRDYSSYLTPQKGVFTADTWTAAATWVRNTLLNLIVLLSVLAAFLLTPRLPVAFIDAATVYLKGIGHVWEELITIVALVFQAIIIFRVVYNLKLFETRRSRPPNKKRI